MDVREFKKKIASIYEIANELGREFNIPRCTPDGHLLGTIGQIAAKIAFGPVGRSQAVLQSCRRPEDSFLTTRRVQVAGNCQRRVFQGATSGAAEVVNLAWRNPERFDGEQDVSDRTEVERRFQPAEFSHPRPLGYARRQ